MIVDSHLHLWDLERVEYPWLVPDYGPIYRTFTADEVQPEIEDAGIDTAILVQAANSFEDTDSMLAHAAERPWIGAVVGWVPLEDPDAAAKALDERYFNDPYLRGVRHLNHEESDPDWLVRPAVLEGLRVLQERRLVYEVVAVHPLHLGHVPTLARELPGLTIVIDHLGKPPLKSGDLDAWRAELSAAADFPNVHAKISGLNTAADWETWTAHDLVPAIGHAIDAFGTDRLLFGSDWPVAVLAGDYAKVWNETNRALDALRVTGRERDAIMGDNAETLYRIGATT